MNNFENASAGKNLRFLTSFEPFGVFELDLAGIVLYFRLRKNNGLTDGKPDLIGECFFDQLTDFENINELKIIFRNFAKGLHPTESFIFNGQISGKIIPAKILLTRICETQSGTHEKLIVLDIKEVPVI